MDGQQLKTYGFLFVVSLRVQCVGILSGVDGEGKKGTASHYLLPQLAVVNSMNIIKTRHSILYGKKILGQIDYLVIISFSSKCCPNVTRMISNT